MNVLISIAVFAVVLSVHEFSHGLAAFRLGDSTAREAGRLTLNPLAHIDPIGTVLLPLLLAFSGSPVILGWAKPVPINPNNFRDPRKGIFLASLAGPLSNFVLAVFFAVMFKTGLFPRGSLVWTFLLNGIIISLILGLFNLIPIPPLDGSGMLFSVLNAKTASRLWWLNRYGFIILIGLLYLGVLEKVILPLAGWITVILLAG